MLVGACTRGCHGCWIVRELGITEYSPRKIKMAITGNGNASKEQVAECFNNLGDLKTLPKTLMLQMGWQLLSVTFSTLLRNLENLFGLGLFVKQEAHRIKNSMSGTILHIPFCKKACHYCNFHFSTSMRYADDMLAAIQQEIRLRNKMLKSFETIYFGGGTPSVLSPAQLQLLMMK
ncbi:MAG: hypothetical protein CM15mP83_4850 [Flavobacteriaceae bacterium]|nr:MAG: hypothetical protein CM15mP83_4850 [Flavobacteriaceae bacterium]